MGDRPAGAVSRVGVDTGGTFTDVVTEDGRVVKLPSTPHDPGAAVADGVRAAGGASTLAHGTTVATNALLERKGGTVALFTTAGFADVIEIGRQDRPSLYDQFADRPEPLVARELRIEVNERVGAGGEVLVALDPDAVPPLPAGADAAAVVFLHSDREPDHERLAARVLRDGGADVTTSCEVSPEFREYERTVTTVLNAYLRKPCRSYLSRLEAVAPSVLVMTSAGGLVPLAEATAQPVRLLLSGPAGGAIAAAEVASAAGFSDAVALDMGGTSTDVCLILDGRPAPAAQRSVAGFPVRLPSLDIHTIGAGGGSIAYLDAGGALRVGPQSAGAVPGPICFGRGGAEVTVTDADLVAGRIPPDAAFPSLGALDLAGARAGLAGLGVEAEDVIRVVDASMVRAVRAVTVERGVDPRALALVAFGGAGPLHACAIADELGMASVLIPPRAGVLSAVGLLAAPRRADFVRSWPTPADHAGLEDALVMIATAASRAVGGSAEVEVGVDCRYAGQSHELTVDDVRGFHAEHRRRNGFAREHALVEVVALRASAAVPSPVAIGSLPRPATRSDAKGPTVLAEEDCTVWVPEGWRATVDASGSWILRRH